MWPDAAKFIYILDAVRKSNLEEFKHPSVADDDTAQRHFSFSNIRCIMSPDGKPRGFCNTVWYRQRAPLDSSFNNPQQEKVFVNEVIIAAERRKA